MRINKISYLKTTGNALSAGLLKWRQTINREGLLLTNNLHVMAENCATNSRINEDETSDDMWEMRVKEAELQYELESRLNSVNLIRQSVNELKEHIKWHKLEQKWINQVPQVGEEMLRLVLELDTDQEITDLDEILQPLLVRRSELRAQLAKLNQMIKN